MIRYRDGHILFVSGEIATHLDCCCPGPCFLCSAGNDPKSSYTVDFGAGGWTDDGCDYCDQVAGEFILGGLGEACNAEYYDDAVCVYEAACDVPTLNFRIRLAIVSAGGGNLKWRVTVEIDNFVVLDPGCPGEYAKAIYESDPFDPDDCDVVPVTLTMTTEDLAGGVCGGGLPATITIDET